MTPAVELDRRLGAYDARHVTGLLSLTQLLHGHVQIRHIRVMVPTVKNLMKNSFQELTSYDGSP